MIGSREVRQLKRDELLACPSSQGLFLFHPTVAGRGKGGRQEGGLRTHTRYKAQKSRCDQGEGRESTQLTQRRRESGENREEEKGYSSGRTIKRGERESQRLKRAKGTVDLSH